MRSVERHSSATFFASQEVCHRLCIKIDPGFVWAPDGAQSYVHAAGIACNAEVEASDRLSGPEAAKDVHHS